MTTIEKAEIYQEALRSGNSCICMNLVLPHCEEKPTKPGDIIKEVGGCSWLVVILLQLVNDA